jgi:hypothetical protein
MLEDLDFGTKLTKHESYIPLCGFYMELHEGVSLNLIMFFLCFSSVDKLVQLVKYFRKELIQCWKFLF